MVDNEQGLGRIPVFKEVRAFGRGFRDATIGGLYYLRGNRDRANRFFGEQFERVTDPDGNYRYNSRAIFDRAGYTAGGLLVVWPMGARDLVQYVLKKVINKR